MNDTPLSTQSYKGVRDFYPDDKRRQNYLFSVMRETAQRFGYQEVGASVLEPAELYDAKSGSELSQEQSYRFEDRGDREVMLRPEMTPTIARLMAAEYKSMSFPVRWFSLPNLFRYEQPQDGRLREHWQLNADLFGIVEPIAELELIQLSHQLLLDFGATPNDFEIRVNSRQLFGSLCADVLECNNETKQQLSRLLDKREKISEEDFDNALADLLSENNRTIVYDYLDSDTPIDFAADYNSDVAEPAANLTSLLERLEKHDITNAHFAPSLVRGLDYYTGSVFEIFDTDPKNPRSICGGGRYDNLMDIFGAERVPAVGFGLGDVTLANFLDNHDLWPEFDAPVDVVIALVSRDKHGGYGYRVANKLRKFGQRVSVDISGSNVGTQFKQAANIGADEVVVIGDDEVENKTVTVKTLATSEETVLDLTALAEFWG
jgi:histidyl-tRNA synthetase